MAATWWLNAGIRDSDGGEGLVDVGWVRRGWGQVTRRVGRPTAFYTPRRTRTFASILALTPPPHFNGRPGPWPVQLTLANERERKISRNRGRDRKGEKVKGRERRGRSPHKSQSHITREFGSLGGKFGGCLVFYRRGGEAEVLGVGGEGAIGLMGVRERGGRRQAALVP